MGKCSFCGQTHLHPRGDKAINEGWTGMDATVGRGANKKVITLIACPKEECHKKLVDEIGKVFKSAQKIKVEHTIPEG
jgi:hypothetical protein